MAFIDQVQDLTSITVSDTDELSQFLKDGVLDVTNKWLLVRPQDIELFGRESAETTSNASLNLNGARIISVIREDGTNNQWRNCTKISPSLQYDVTDTDSLNYASKTNPVYMIGDAGKISVFPAPGSDPNAFKVYYVNKDPVNGSGSALIHSHDDILYFPIDKVYLVVMYAGIRLLQATMGSNVISITAVPPDVPSLISLSYADPGATDASLTAVAAGDILGSATQPSYDSSVANTAIALVTSTIAEANNFIDSNEDVELASAKLAEVQATINDANLRIQNELNEFNEENIKYQASVQESMAEFQSQNQINLQNATNSNNRLLQGAIQDAKVKLDNNTQAIQKYQAEISEYQAEVTLAVQEQTTKMQHYQLLYSQLKTEYDQVFVMAAPQAQA